MSIHGHAVFALQLENLILSYCPELARKGSAFKHGEHRFCSMLLIGTKQAKLFKIYCVLFPNGTEETGT